MSSPHCQARGEEATGTAGQGKSVNGNVFRPRSRTKPLYWSEPASRRRQKPVSTMYGSDDITRWIRYLILKPLRRLISCIAGACTGMHAEWLVEQKRILPRDTLNSFKRSQGGASLLARTKEAVSILAGGRRALAESQAAGWCGMHVEGSSSGHGCSGPQGLTRRCLLSIC